MRNLIIIIGLLFSLNLSANCDGWCCCKAAETGITCSNIEKVFEEKAGIGAFGFVDSDGTLINGFNVTSTRLSAGVYQISFVDPKGIDNYVVVSGYTDNTVTRDGKNPFVGDGTQLVSGFQMWTTTGDNGGNADPPVDASFYFSIPCTENRLVDFQCAD